MKILHVLNNFNQGGAEALVYDVLLHSVDDAHNSMFAFAMFPSGSETHQSRVDRLEKMGVSVAKGHRLTLFQICTIARLFVCERPDVVHCHNLRALLISVAISFFLPFKPKLVFTQHISFLRRPIVHKFIKNFVAAYVAICRSVQVDIENKLGRSAYYIPNGIRPFSKKPGPAVDKDKINLVTVGRFQEQKGHFLLVESMAELKRRGVLASFHFWLIGEGELKSEIQRKVKDGNLSEHASFLGNVDNARQILHQFDALLLTSLYEGLPIVVLEALFSQIEVISTSVGGIPDVIVDGVNGLLVKQGDAMSIADALEAFRAKKVNGLLDRKWSPTSFKLTVDNNYCQHVQMYKDLRTKGSSR